MRKQYSLFFLCLLLLLLLTGCTSQQETLSYYHDSYNQGAEKDGMEANGEADGGETGDVVTQVVTIVTPSP